MSQISAVIATKNEENNIRECLESVKWADEIVVVDDVSTDRTVDICKKYTSKIYINDSKGSFHINRKGATTWPLEIHDVPQISETDKVEYLHNPMIHISYTSIEQYLDKFARYTTRLAHEEFDNGVRVRRTNFLSLFLVKPLFWLFRKYVIKRGYVDGFRGFFISVASAMTIFMTYAKLWEMQNRE